MFLQRITGSPSIKIFRPNVKFGEETSDIFALLQQLRQTAIQRQLIPRIKYKHNVLSQKLKTLLGTEHCLLVPFWTLPMDGDIPLKKQAPSLSRLDILREFKKFPGGIMLFPSPKSIRGIQSWPKEEMIEQERKTIESFQDALHILAREGYLMSRYASQRKPIVLFLDTADVPARHSPELKPSYHLTDPTEHLLTVINQFFILKDKTSLYAN